VLPNQEWQHPEPAELHYCEIGTLVGDERVTQLLESTLDLGIGQSGGHGRILDLEDCPWLNDRLETWADRQARTEEDEAEAERQRYAEEMARARCTTSASGAVARRNSARDLSIAARVTAWPAVAVWETPLPASVLTASICLIERSARRLLGKRSCTLGRNRSDADRAAQCAHSQSQHAPVRPHA